MDAVFRAISREGHWNYWHFNLLEKIVETFGGKNQEMISWIESYRKQLTDYKATTKIIDHIAAVELMHDSPSDEKEKEEYDQQYYTTLTMKLGTTFTGHTLEYIDTLWKKFADLHHLPSRVELLHHIHSGCVSIVWRVPSCLASQIQDAAPHTGDFYCANYITRVELNRKCIYQEEESVNVCSCSKCRLS